MGFVQILYNNMHVQYKSAAIFNQFVFCVIVIYSGKYTFQHAAERDYGLVHNQNHVSLERCTYLKPFYQVDLKNAFTVKNKRRRGEEFTGV